VLGPHYKYREEVVPKPKAQLTAVDDEPKTENLQAMNWARLLKRVFGVDVETCPLCQAKVRIIAAIEDPPVIKKILEHLGLPTSPPRFHSARGPPPTQLDEYAQASSQYFDHSQHFPD
jgi:hypothetical protein